MNTVPERKNTPHQRRMSRIAVFSPPPLEDTRGYQAWKEFLRSLPRNPEVNRKINSAFKTATSTMQAQLDNGAGFSQDGILREFLLEYNGRIFKYGIRSMPSSFNVMEAFYSYTPKLAIFKILPEKDHLFSSVQFLDFVTSRDAPSDFGQAASILENNVIYSYNVINDLSDITFSIEKGTKCAIGGVSIIRHDTEVSILMLAGQETDLSKQSDKLRAMPVSDPYPGKEQITPAEGLVRQAEALFGSSNFWKTLVGVRIDVSTATLDARYVLLDCGDSYIDYTDDLSGLMSQIPPYSILPQYKELADNMVRSVKEYSTLFELCKTLLYLPSFFMVNTDEIIIENHPTELFKRIKKSHKYNKKIQSIDASERITQRPVSALELPSTQYPARSLYQPPNIKTETSGFWKKLRPDELGRNKYGFIIHGRTWVQQTLTYSQGSVDSRPILAEHTAIPTSYKQENSNTGYIYVMRSAAHAKDIFKIGLTRRSSDIRSDELARSTGSPDKFLVVQEWLVQDCAKVETLVHQNLDKYRINPTREFFQAPYKIIREAIERIVTQASD